MKLALSVNKPLNGHVFQATDKVQGRVDVQMDDVSDTPEVRVVFQGIAKVTLKPGFDAKAQIGDTHKRQSYKIFTSVQVLHPTPVNDNTLSAPFAFAFPPADRCCGRANTAKSAVCPLPPSTLLVTPGVKVRVSYGVTAVCRRPGSGLYHRLLHRPVTARQSITYAPPITEQLLYGTAAPVQSIRPVQARPPTVSLPLSPPQSPPISPVSIVSDPLLDAHTDVTDTTAGARQLVRSTAWMPASKLGIEERSSTDAADAWAVKAQNPPVLPGCLPAYSPAISLEMVMPNLPVITPGQPLDLGLFLRTPRSFLDTVADTGCTLQLCSLSVRLRRQIHAQIGAATRVDDTTWPLWSVKGSVPIRQEKVDIACGGSGGSSSSSHGDDNSSDDTAGGIHLPPATIAAIQGQPGFATCFASRVYTLEVSMGVAAVTTSSTPPGKKPVVPKAEIQYTKTALRVIVSEPPPDYEWNTSDGE
ncbi:uncharacterized protein SPSK_06221 [Sporothrix schenckii 1099-18]|uniref:Arrestin-like N-terminal domain-containing protein n=1 Tax=Sporothrix schenckii 1099-18 TaxID=1397361 RepID=A0A0F2MIS5_SPOSC|nr:uncharacterized protein SPSK_06221 [Sporothrix schenckii 1099-18]KJR89603.1 hypothetical protein SPSK_06221 [Sporothrix schenckii 1099-18]